MIIFTDKIKSKTGAEINAQSTENTELKSSRKSIYDLDSYIPTTSLGTDYSKSGESEEVIASPEKNIHYSQSVVGINYLQETCSL